MVDTQLPPLVEFGGDWQEYEDTLYPIYMDTIVHGTLVFEGKNVRYERYPTYKDKDYSFWHITSTGSNEEERVPEFDRCERIRWVSWLIENYRSDPRISWWENKRGAKTHIIVWFDDEDIDESFAVILKKLSGFVLLKSAYCIRGHRRATFVKEREEFLLAQKQQKPPRGTASNAPSTHGR